MSPRPSVGVAVAIVALLAAIGFGSIAAIVYGLFLLASGEPDTVPPAGRAASAVEAAGDLVAPLVARRAEYSFAIYHLRRNARSGVQLARAEVERGFDGLTVRESGSDEAPLPSVLVRDGSADDLPPPPRELVPSVSRGLTRAQVRQLQRAKRVTILEFSSRGGLAGLAHLRAAYALTLAVAKKTGGLVLDSSTGELFSREAWEGTRVATWRGGIPYLPDHFVIRYHSSGTLNRAKTIGLQKVGLPDLAFDDFARSSTNTVGSLLRLVAQTMLERGGSLNAGRLYVSIDGLENRRAREALTEVCHDDAEKRAELSLAMADRVAGDPDNRRWTIVFPGEAQSLQERQEELLCRVFGCLDEVSEVEHDAEILSASERARARLLGELKRKFVGGLAPAERLLVEVPFETPGGGNEWMWLEVIAWEGDQLRGILVNEPVHIPDLRSGARVQKSEADLFDYIFYTADGDKKGNETGEIIMRRQADKN